MLLYNKIFTIFTTTFKFITYENNLLLLLALLLFYFIL